MPKNSLILAFRLLNFIVTTHQLAILTAKERTKIEKNKISRSNGNS